MKYKSRADFTVASLKTILSKNLYARFDDCRYHSLRDIDYALEMNFERKQLPSQQSVE